MTPIPTLQTEDLIDAGEAGCDVDPDAISACVTHEGMIVLRRAVQDLMAWQREALILCGETPREGPTL